MEQETHIAGVLVHSTPARVREVAAALQAWPELEIGPSDNHGRLIVVCEGESGRAVLDLIDTMRELPDVHNVVLVYQHAEPAGAMDEEIGDEHHQTRLY